ncbi:MULTISPECIES: Zn-ribbon domain-containing OB-fold protein [unclassified Bradyrhizobium]
MNQLSNVETVSTDRDAIGSQGSGRLFASRDRATGQCVFPPVPARSPSAHRYEPVTLSRTARLYSFSVIHPNPKTGEQPFVVIYADFPEGARAFGRLLLPQEQRPLVGMPVEARITGQGVATTYAFVPGEGARS